MENSAGAPTAEQRRICWKARDNFLACLKLHCSEEDRKKNCEKLQETFEASCPKTWVIISNLNLSAEYLNLPNLFLSLFKIVLY